MRVGRTMALMGGLCACAPNTGPSDHPARDSDVIDTDLSLDSDPPDPEDTDQAAPGDTDVDTDVDTDADTAGPPMDADLAHPEHIPGALFGTDAGGDVGFYQGSGTTGPCRMLSLPGGAPLVYPVGVIDLTGDAVPEVVLFNEQCEDPSRPGQWLRHPVLTWDVPTGRLRPIGAFADHIARGVALHNYVGTASFVDVDGDGKLDLVSDWAVTWQRFDRDPGGFVLMNDGHDSFALAPVTASPGASEYQYAGSPSGVVALSDLDGDGDMDLVADVTNSVFAVKVVAIFNHSDRLAPGSVEPRFSVDFSYFQGAALTSVFGFASFAFDPRRPDQGFLITEGSDGVGGVPGAEYVYQVGTTSAVQVADDFISERSPADGYYFNFPECTDLNLTCAMPMGGSQIRFPDLRGGQLAWRDCLTTATGKSPVPVLVLCEDELSSHLWEDGALTQAFNNVLSQPVPTTPLGWAIDGRFDLNADGMADVMVMNGEDQGHFPIQESYVYLTDPACLDGSCPRYAQKFLPKGAGHAHGVLWFPVPTSNGGTKMLIVSTSDAVGAEGHPQFLTWEAEPSRRWFALQLGGLGDLRATGAIVRYRFLDASGAPLRDAVLGQELQVVASLAVTWGFPGLNSPVVLGVPEHAASVHVTVELPGASATVRELDIDASTGWNRSYDVAVAPTP